MHVQSPTIVSLVCSPFAQHVSKRDLPAVLTTGPLQCVKTHYISKCALKGDWSPITSLCLILSCHSPEFQSDSCSIKAKISRIVPTMTYHFMNSLFNIRIESPKICQLQKVCSKKCEGLPHDRTKYQLNSILLILLY